MYYILGMDAEKNWQNISRYEKTTNVEMCKGKCLNLNMWDKLELGDGMSTETKMWAFLNMENEYVSYYTGYETKNSCKMKEVESN